MGEFLCIMAVAFVIAVFIGIVIAVKNNTPQNTNPTYHFEHKEDEVLAELFAEEDEDEEDDDDEEEEDEY